MKTKEIVLTLMVGALTQIPSGFASDFQSTTEQVQRANARFEIYPVKHSKTDCKNCFDFDGSYLLKIKNKPSLTFEDFEYETFTDNTFGIKFNLNEKKARQLEKLTRKYLNTKLALVHNGRVLASPTVSSIIEGDKFEISFNDAGRFQWVLENLK
jgi:preprotein translocase subunit SecD